MEELIKQIFQEIDETIESCKGNKPIPFDKSNFKKKYEEIKKKYLKN